MNLDPVLTLHEYLQLGEEIYKCVWYIYILHCVKHPIITVKVVIVRILCTQPFICLLYIVSFVMCTTWTKNMTKLMSITTLSQS